MAFRNHVTSFRARASIGIVAMSLAASSCTGVGDRPRVAVARSGKELGSINMSVVSVTRWQDVANDLEPQLPIDRQRIYDEGVPTTSTAAERIADVLQARLGVAIAGTTLDAADTSTFNRTSNSNTQVTGDATTTSSGTTSAASQDERRSASRKTPDVPGLADLATTSAPAVPGTRMTPSAVDPVTRATNAASVIQSIVEINRSIRDAVRQAGYEPYLVRVQFGVQPRRREQPFDTTIRVAFLPGHDSVTELQASDRSLLPDNGVGVRGLPLLSSSRSYGELDRSKPTDEQVTDYMSARSVLDAVRSEDVHVSGMAEEAYGYRVRLIGQAGAARTILVSKACFFPFLARYLAEKEGVSGSRASPPDREVARSYTAFSNSARFASGFYEQLANDAGAGCGDRDLVDRWRRIRDRLRLQVPRVVTLVQTDNLEGTREYYAAEQLRQAALTVSALGGGVAGRGGLARSIDRIDDYEATRLNSVYSISQLATNAVQIRLGAARFGRRFEMVPRTVSATLLLLVPREQAGDVVQLVARPSFNNAETGATLVLTGAETLARDRLVNPVLAQLYCSGAKGPAATACLEALTRVLNVEVEAGDWPGFVAAISRFNEGAGSGGICMRYEGGERLCRREVWTELQREGSRLRATPFASAQLPPVSTRDLPPMQSAVMTASAGTTSVSVSGVDPWLKGSLRASLSTDCRSGPNRGGTGVGVMSRDLSVSGDVGTFTFPGVDGFEPSRLCLWLDDPNYVPAVLATVDGFSARNPESYPVVRAGEGGTKTAKPPFTISSDDRMVQVASDGTASLHVAIGGFDGKRIDSVLVSASGSIIDPGTAARAPGRFAAVATGDIATELRLGGLDPRAAVKLTAQGRKGGKDVGAPVSLTVPAQAAKNAK